MLRPSSDRQLADAIHVPYQRVNELINGKRGVIPSTALRLAKVFGTSSEFWLNLQMRWDVYCAQEAEAKGKSHISNPIDV
jgi:antitoxin HigA-1